MLRRGATASPAAVVMSSGAKTNENADLIKAVQKAKKWPVFLFETKYGSANAPGDFQYRKPRRSWLGPPPKNNTTPRMIKPRIAMILSDANQNSASPYHDTAIMLRRRITSPALEFML